MLYRLFAVLIVGFWLVMMALLIRLEVSPDKSHVLEVPVSHVIRLILDHDQQSLLSLKEHGEPVGVVTFLPRKTETGHALECTGSVTLHLPMIERQRISWTANFEMDSQTNARSFTLDLAMREPGYRIVLSSNVSERAIHYETHETGRLLARGTISLDEATAAATLKQMGINSELVRNVQKNLASPVVT